MKKYIVSGCTAASLLLSGCRSAFVDATVKNESSQSVTLVQVDYPSASFGWQSIPPGTGRHYRFKILGTGPATLTYTDSTGLEHRGTGPVLHEGESGPLVITISQARIGWMPDLKRQ